MKTAEARTVFGKIRSHVRDVVAAEWRAHKELRLFAEATSFEELCALYERFVLGELSCTPDHGGPRDRETVEIAEALAAANRAGYLTVGSQPGANAEDWEGSEQRAAVEGFARDDIAERLQSLYRGTRIVVRVRTSQGIGWKRYDYSESVIVSRTGDHPHTDFGAKFGRRGIEGIFANVADRLVDEVIPMNQVLIYDPKWGNHRLLWDRLETL